MRKQQLLVGLGALVLVAGASAVGCVPMSPQSCRCDQAASGPPTAQQGGEGPMKGLPVICSLPDVELRERLADSLPKFMGQVLETKPLDSGYAFRFAADDLLLSDVVAVIKAERKCCAFLKFKLEVFPDEGPVWLEITGPAETKAFLQKALRLPL